MQAVHATLKVGEGGRIVIPAEVRERLGLKTGSEVHLSVEGDTATLMSAEAAIRRAQARVAKYIKPGTTLSDELMADRRREAKRE